MAHKYLMTCGCMAQTAYKGAEHGSVPICFVHGCVEVSKMIPDLSGRMAYCGADKHKGKPSSLDLAFFEYHGEGSRRAQEICNCDYAEVAHEIKDREKPSHLRGCCDNFIPRGPSPSDTYYCGCRGWD